MIKFRDTNEPDGLSRLINREIDRALITERALEVKHDYLGASVLGDPCDHRLAYRYAGVEEDGIDGRRLRIFEAGHAFEGMLVRWLRLAGFDLRDLNPDTGKQFEFSAGDVRGHVDGIIARGPDLGVSYPLLWEAKSLNDAGWGKLLHNGLEAANQIYFGQVQTYLSQLPPIVPYGGVSPVRLKTCLFTALNKDTCALYHELGVDPVWWTVRRLGRLGLLEHLHLVGDWG
jgi:hypothetical protein